MLIFSIYLAFFVTVVILFFLPHCTACKILVHGPEVRPEFLCWECQVQTTGLTENIRTQGI